MQQDKSRQKNSEQSCRCGRQAEGKANAALRKPAIGEQMMQMTAIGTQRISTLQKASNDSERQVTKRQ